MQVDPKFVILEYLNGTGLCWNFWYSESRIFNVLQKRMQLNMFKLKWYDTYYLLTVSSTKRLKDNFFPCYSCCSLKLLLAAAIPLGRRLVIR